MLYCLFSLIYNPEVSYHPEVSGTDDLGAHSRPFLLLFIRRRFCIKGSRVSTSAIRLPDSPGRSTSTASPKFSLRLNSSTFILILPHSSAFIRFRLQSTGPDASRFIHDFCQSWWRSSFSWWCFGWDWPPVLSLTVRSRSGRVMRKRVLCHNVYHRVSYQERATHITCLKSAILFYSPCFSY